MEGPVFLASGGQRLGPHGAALAVRRVGRRAGIARPVGPPTLLSGVTLTAQPSARRIVSAAEQPVWIAVSV